jgi:hypothetical protein
MLKLGAYVCIALLLAGVLTWGVSYLFEPKVHFITGTIQSLELKGVGLLPSTTFQSWSYGSLPIISNETNTMDSEFIRNASSRALSLLGEPANISRTSAVIFENPSGSKIGVGFFVSIHESKKLLIFLSDGEVMEYTLPNN